MAEFKVIRKIDEPEYNSHASSQGWRLYGDAGEGEWDTRSVVIYKGDIKHNVGPQNIYNIFDRFVFEDQTEEENIRYSFSFEDDWTLTEI